MPSAPSGCVVARALVLATLWLAVAGRPLALSDQGPHLYYGWDEPIRLRHLYAAGPYGRSNCFLRIHSDGSVDCEENQSQHSECPPGPPAPTLPSALLPFAPPQPPQTPGFGTVAIPSLPWFPDNTGDAGTRTVSTHVLQPFASLTRFAGDQGGCSADRGHQGRKQRQVPLHG
jgi:hypothetical protein